MKKHLITLAAAAPLVSAATSVFAHEGHGASGWAGTVFHYLLEPEHGAVAIMVAVCATFLIARLTRGLPSGRRRAGQ